MPFTTITFIAFFSVAFFAYYIVPRRFQWCWLLLSSLFFYAYASLFALVFLLATVSLSFGAAMGIGSLYARRDALLKEKKSLWSRDERKEYRARITRTGEVYLSLVLCALFGCLVAFKYLQFLFDNFVRICGFCGWTVLPSEFNWILPIGMSFYIFQSAGYLIDVFREAVVPERNFLRYALFVSYFPQIMQGPIGSFSDLAPQLTASHDFDGHTASLGLQRVVWGFAKKLCVANCIAMMINPVWENPEKYSGFCCWGFFSFLYAIQIYADFSGYMDIACGCSQMLGIRIAENFNCPYFSSDIPEYWRRWHMTLGNWFKNYLFYPVLLSRWNSRLRKIFSSKYLSSVVPTTIALIIVWLTTGLWHGASWGYVAWGAYFGFFIILNLMTEPIRKRFYERFPHLVSSRLYRCWNIVLTFAVVVVGYSIFKPGDLGVTWSIWRSAMSAFDFHSLHCFISWRKPTLGLLLVAMVVLFVVDLIHIRHPKGWIRAKIGAMPLCVRWMCYLAAVLVVLFAGYNGADVNQFEYFKF